MPRHYRYRYHRRQTQRTGLAVVAFILLSLPLASFTQPQTFLNPMGADTVSVHRVQAVEPIEPEQPKIVPSNDIEAYILEVFGDEYSNAMAILSCENKGLNPKATNHNRNGSLDVGIFQINSIHGYSQTYLENYRNNIDVAYKIYQRDGWSAWSCSHKINVVPFYLK